MWYNIDLTHFARQLFPPVLRGAVVTAFLQALVDPLCRLHEDFLAFRKKISKRLYITANVQYVQKALNDAFFMTDNQIYIDSLEEERPTAFYISGVLMKIPTRKHMRSLSRHSFAPFWMNKPVNTGAKTYKPSKPF